MNHQKEWLYKKNKDNTTRYVLGTKGFTPLICFGINPSTASPEQLDNTLKSVQRIAFHNGFDSWIMLNIYPQRATDPNDMHTTLNASIHKNNLTHIQQLLGHIARPTLWAAWGTLIEKRPFLLSCLNDIHKKTMNHDCQWVTFGNKSSKGHPHHPLYLPAASTPDQFDIQNYLCEHLS